MQKVLGLDANGFQQEIPLTPETIGDVILTTPLTGLPSTLDLTNLSNLNTVLEAFAKLQAQVLTKDTVLKIEYLTGTTVLSTAQNAAIIDSPVDCTIFLPAGVDQQKYRLRNVGTGKVLFVPFGTDTIEKQTNLLLEASNAFDLVFLNGNWYIF